MTPARDPLQEAAEKYAEPIADDYTTDRTRSAWQQVRADLIAAFRAGARSRQEEMDALKEERNKFKNYHAMAIEERDALKAECSGMGKVLESGVVIKTDDYSKMIDERDALEAELALAQSDASAKHKYRADVLEKERDALRAERDALKAELKGQCLGMGDDFGDSPIEVIRALKIERDALREVDQQAREGERVKALKQCLNEWPCDCDGAASRIEAELAIRARSEKAESEEK